jgi:muramoyltetrapeptide carboxypeptidase
VNYLMPGDTIGVCAPSARFDKDKFHKGVQILEQMGFKVVVPKAVFEKKRYLAGDDRARAKVFESLSADPDIRGIICARGGFGAMRMLPYIDWAVVEKHPTLTIGFSDNTALLMAITRKTGQPVVHGPTLLSLADAGQATLDSFYNTITGRTSSFSDSDARCLIPGISTGILLGGNLATLAHLTGTPFEPDFRDAVFFIEDVGEPAYKIDRMLSQMKMAGLFENLKGVLAGTFTDCRQSSYIDEILMEIFSGYNIPILGSMNAGHGSINHSLVMGQQIYLDASGKKISWEL